MRTLKVAALALLMFASGPASQNATAQSGVATGSHSELRSCRCSADKATTQTALDLKHAGWTYVMPEPKSRQAAWGNRDGRTTWFYGYWTNLKNHSSSSLQPIKDGTAQWVGDEKGLQAWRNGGSPRAPTQVEWLCSERGGIEPA